MLCNPGFSQMEKISIFIDGSNLYPLLKDLFKDEKPINFNFEKFANHLAMGRQLINVFYYNAPLDRNKDEEGYRKQQKFFDKIKRIPKLNLILCRMQKRKIGKIIIYEVKEDDIHLAVDMVKLAYKNSYDTAILVSTDGDFVPAIEAIKEKDKKIEIVGFENRFSWHLRQKSDRFIKLNKHDLLNFFDK